MQPYSDYEIAQRRITERHKKKNHFQMALVFLAVPTFLIVFSPDISVKQCMIPIAVVIGIFVIRGWIELYYARPEHTPSRLEVEQEIEWLFEEHQLEDLGVQAYALAHDRIRKRRVGRWRFFAHLLLFILIDTLIVVAATKQKYPTDAGILLLIAFMWLVIIINHARSTFLSKRALARQEINFGKSLHIELTNLKPEKAKNKEKLKRGKYYQVGDDGELEEVEDEVVGSDEKPKRIMDEVDNHYNEMGGGKY